MSRKVPVTLRLELSTADQLAKFCAATHRSEQDTLRAMLELFLADGPAAAEARLTRGLWDVKAAARAEIEEGPPGKPAPKKPARSK